MSRRTLRRTCGRCGASPGTDVSLVSLVSHRCFLGYCKGLNVEALCVNCYAFVWREKEREALAAKRAEYRALLPRFAVIDFETTSLKQPAAVEVALWGAQGLLYSSLVDPGPTVRWEPEAMAVSGLTPAVVAGAPAWPAVEAELLAVLSRQGITRLGAWGHFDRGVVWTEGERRGGGPVWPVTWLDLMTIHDCELARQYPVYYFRGLWLPPVPRTSLSRACRRAKVPAGTHRAATDAEAAYRVFVSMTSP